MKSKIQWSVLSAAVLFFGMGTASAGENPIYEMFPDNITFSLNFNNGTYDADMASGKNTPISTSKDSAIEDKGLFGKGLAAGNVRFDAEKNLNLTSPGTLILWVSPLNWPEAKPENQKEPGFSAFIGKGANEQYTYNLIVSKMSGQPWGHGHINTYVQYQPFSIPHVNCVVFNSAITSKWKNGTWKMIAVTWGAGNFSTSVDNAAPKTSLLKNLMTGAMKFLQVGVSDKNYRVMVDEIVILNRTLSNEEIQKLYNATLAATDKK